MFNNEIFANRIKSLRICHDLSVSQLAELLSLKSKGSISAFESQRGFPSYETLVYIADLFAVSLDWLTGRSDTPYVHEILLKQESHILKIGDHPSIINYPELGYFYRAIWEINKNPKYSDPQTRDYFPLAVRANILFSLTVLNYASKKLYLDKYNSQMTPLEQIISDLLNSKNKTSKQFGILCYTCLDTLTTYMNERHFSNPIFDISKPLE